MASTLAPTITADAVVSFAIHPGTISQFLGARAERGPLLKCFAGRVTLVSPGKTHETMARRLDLLLTAVCLELGIRIAGMGSTTWRPAAGAGDAAYEADRAYYVQNQGTGREDLPPDLAIEVVVSHPETKALEAGALLKIPEMWVFDVPRRRLTFYRLAVRGRAKGAYRAHAESRAFPFLRSAEVLERLDDPQGDDIAFFRDCQRWAGDVLLPRWRKDGGD